MGQLAQREGSTLIFGDHERELPGVEKRRRRRTGSWF